MISGEVCTAVSGHELSRSHRTARRGAQKNARPKRFDETSARLLLAFLFRCRENREAKRNTFSRQIFNSVNLCSRRRRPLLTISALPPPSPSAWPEQYSRDAACILSANELFWYLFLSPLYTWMYIRCMRVCVPSPELIRRVANICAYSSRPALVLPVVPLLTWRWREMTWRDVRWDAMRWVELLVYCIVFPLHVQGDRAHEIPAPSERVRAARRRVQRRQRVCSALMPSAVHTHYNTIQTIQYCT